MYATIPVYYPSLEEAARKDEAALWCDSYNINMSCRNFIQDTGCRFEKRQRKDMILPAAATVSTFLSRRARRGADGSAKTLPRRWKPLVIKAQLLPGAA